jgi:hypothetical protein
MPSPPTRIVVASHHTDHSLRLVGSCTVDHCAMAALYAGPMLPAVRAALICEQVLTERDGVHSAIRIIHRFELPPGAYFESKLLLMLANTRVMESPHHRILMRVESSQREILSGTEFVVETPLAAGDTFSVIVPFRFQAPATDDMFWLSFAFDSDDQILTRVPVQFRVAMVSRPAPT